VFFNLFFEAEPFAAILIAHRTHGLGRALMRPTGPKFEAKGRQQGSGLLGEEAASLLLTS